MFWKKYFLGQVLFFFLHSLSLSTIFSFFSHNLIWASKVKETNWEKENEAYCAGVLSTGHTKGIYTVTFFPRRALSFSLLLWPSLGKHFPLNCQLWARSWAQGPHSQLTSEHSTTTLKLFNDHIKAQVSTAESPSFQSNTSVVPAPAYPDRKLQIHPWIPISSHLYPLVSWQCCFFKMSLAASCWCCFHSSCSSYLACEQRQ